MNVYALLSALSLIGFLIARYIWKYKRNPRGASFVCPFNLRCNYVVNSSYGSTFGIRNELAGMGYYGLLFVFYALAASLPTTPYEGLFPLAFWLSAMAFAFSCYLVFIMWRVLKAWCFWCITSAILSTLIFFITLSLWY